ncbi:MAG: hypothetical protein RRC07_06140 [Anaerolineae bacterium]|nr:hypothetical protein [Anaerolineae bacterium]
MLRSKLWLTAGITLFVLLIAGHLHTATGRQPFAPAEDFWFFIPLVASEGQQATPTPQPTTISPPPTRPPAGSIVVNHTSVTQFEHIPEQYLNAAANLRMLFIDRSVGGNINDGLTCLSYPSDEVAPSHCKRWEHPVAAYSVDPGELNWSRPDGYDRSNWEYRYWEGDCAYWSSKIDCFIQMVSPDINQYDVVSFQYSYLSVDESSTIADQPGGYFWDNAAYSDVYDQEAYEAQHPDKIFIYWTTSLARGIGTTVATDFNNQMREYAIANQKPLFDVADILSHTPDGRPCYDNRDGVPYDPRPDDPDNPVENYPDDGVNLPAICQEYTTETDGGHLGSVSAGKIRVAKAFWVLMARIAGWDGVVR